MMNRACMVMPITGRTPHGVRGLKLSESFGVDMGAVSHPSRGAWIEITISGGSVARRGRTPHGVRGLKCGGGCPLGCLPCRTPHGVRGLKYAGMWVSDTDPRSHPSRGAWIEIFRLRLQGHGLHVAPLTGCVD